jgi:tetratricopeptide (TPR) repeat protein
MAAAPCSPLSTAAANAGTPTHGELAASEARALHEQGILAFSEGDFTRAIEHFSRAARLRPDPALSYNLARAYERLHDDAQALAHYRTYLDTARAASDGPSVEARIAVLHREVQLAQLRQLRIEAEPKDAAIWIDGEPVGHASVVLRLPQGSHHARVQLPGYRSRVIPLRLAAAGTATPALEIHVTLEPNVATGEASDGRSSHAQAADNRRWGPHEVDGAADAPNVVRDIGLAAMLAGVSSFGGALALELMRASTAREASQETEQTRFAKLLDDVHARQTWARVFVGAGGALTALGITLLVVSTQQDGTSPKTRVALHCAPSKCRAELSGTF